MLFTCFGCRKKDFLWNRSGNGDFHVFSVDFKFSRAKTRKLRSRASGWASGNVGKVLRLISNPSWGVRPWLDFSRITHFLWKWVEFHQISWKFCDFAPFSAPWGGNGAWAAPERKHQRNLCFSYAFLGVPGTEKCVSGWIWAKNAVPSAFWWKSSKWVEFRGIPPFSLNFQLLGVPRGPGPQKGMEFTSIIKGFARSAGDRRKYCFPYSTVNSHNATGNHDFT